jgi:hypothetical protein
MGAEAVANSGAQNLSNVISAYLKGLGYNNPSAGYTPEQIKSNAGTQKETVENLKGAFDIVAWIRENWQLAILGLIAILVLLKD